MNSLGKIDRLLALYLLLLDKLFLGDNEVSVKLVEDLHKKIQFLLHFWGITDTIEVSYLVKRDMKYDSWDNMCDFPVKELSGLIGHYVTHRCFKDSSDLRI